MLSKLCIHAVISKNWFTIHATTSTFQKDAKSISFFSKYTSSHLNWYDGSFKRPKLSLKPSHGQLELRGIGQYFFKSCLFKRLFATKYVKWLVELMCISTFSMQMSCSQSIIFKNEGSVIHSKNLSLLEISLGNSLFKHVSI